MELPFLPAMLLPAPSFLNVPRMLIHHYAILHVVYLHFRSHPWNALDLLSAVDWIEQCYSASWETPSRQ